MLELMNAGQTKHEVFDYIMNIDFTDQPVGATTIVDKTGNNVFTMLGTNVGQVINDPVMGKCFEFTGNGGFISNINPVIDNAEIVADIWPSDQTTRTIAYTGLYSSSKQIQGWSLYSNHPTYSGECGWSQTQGGSYQAVGGGAMGINRRKVSFKVGPKIGTVIAVDGVVRSGGVALPNIPGTASPSLYVGMLDPVHNNVYGYFKGKLKYLRIIRR